MCSPVAWLVTCVALVLGGVVLAGVLCLGKLWPGELPIAWVPAVMLGVSVYMQAVTVLMIRKVMGVPCPLADFWRSRWCIAVFVCVVAAMAWNPWTWSDTSMLWAGLAVDLVQCVVTWGAFLCDRHAGWQAPYDTRVAPHDATLLPLMSTEVHHHLETRGPCHVVVVNDALGRQ